MSPKSATAVRSSERIPALDGLRGLAIVLVVLRHSVVFGGFIARSLPDVIFNTVAMTGWVGVDLFFVLSGFLITGILYDTRGDQHYYRTFYARRALRIVPLYYVFLLVYLLSAPLLIPPDQSPALGWRGLLWSGSYLSNYPTGLYGWGVLPHPIRHSWSLAVEEQFYLLWPLLIRRFSARALIRICLGAVAVGWVIRAGLVADGLGVAAYVWAPARLAPLALGGGVAIAARDPEVLRRLVRWAWPAIVAVTLVLMFTLALQRNLSYDRPITQLTIFDPVAVLFGAAVVLAITATPGSAVHKLSTLTTLRTFGRYSYAIYLFHQPVILALRGTGLSSAMLPTVDGSNWPGALAFTVCAGALSLALALVSWNVLEAHFLRLKLRVPYGSSRASPGAVRPLPTAVPSGAAMADVAETPAGGAL